jgi:hypothetical protein
VFVPGVAHEETLHQLTALPDPLLMNAFNNINVAAACILTSTQFARELGVPEDKWIYPLGGAGTRDSDNCERIDSPQRKRG